MLGWAVPIAVVLFLLCCLPYWRADRAYLDAHRRRHGLWPSREEEYANLLMSGGFPPPGPTRARLSALLNFQADEQLEALRLRVLRRLVLAILAFVLAFPLALVLETLAEFLVVRPIFRTLQPILETVPHAAAVVAVLAVVAGVWGVLFACALRGRLPVRPWVPLLGAAVSEVYIAMLFWR